MIEFIKLRHSVRQYEDKSIETPKREALNNLIEKINTENNLHFQICYDEPTAFNTFLAHYGKFEGVANYICLVAQKNKDEEVGYFGEQLVVLAQSLGLNTCWVALTYGKNKTKITKEKNEKLYCTLALGYGKTQGVAHKSKSPTSVSNLTETSPEWFKNGVEASLLAPTAMNQQKFKFTLNEDNSVSAKANSGFYTKIDLGIAKYHFEIGANQPVEWKK